jgi:hypothetical protein
MAKDKVEEEEKEPVMLATGPAAPIPHLDYCRPQCYKMGKRERRSSCTCKGCEGEAHGRGKEHAFSQGYLPYSPPVSRKPKHGQESLFSEALAEVVFIDQPLTENT